jgi:hypothetical protein
VQPQEPDHPDHQNLAFEVTANRGGPIDGQALTITSVVRDEHGIRINYELDPALPDGIVGIAGAGPQGVAEDDLGNRSDDWGGAFGRHPDRPDRTDGVLTMRIPTAPASLLRVHIAWDPDAAYEFPFPHPNVELSIKL